MSIINLLVAARNVFAEWRANQQAYGELLALDDHVLADVGLHRSQIPTLYRYGRGAAATATMLAQQRPRPIRARGTGRNRHAELPLPRRAGAARLMLLAAAIGAAAALPASAAQFGTTARYGVSPSQPFSSPADSPAQQQLQQDYRTNLLAAQRDLLQANPSGLGRQQIEIQHQLDTMPP